MSAGSGFHFVYPRAKVYKLNAGSNWGVIVSGRDFPEPVSFRDLSYAHNHAAKLVGNLRATTEPEPVRGVKPRKGRTPTLATRPTHCPDCGRPVRLNTDKAAEHPGTVCMFSSKTGLCTRCHRARQGSSGTQRPVRTLPADEPATMPMTPAEVKAAMPAPRSPRPAPLRPVPAPVVTEQVREATAAYTPPATTPIGPHYLKPDADGDPFCACGWDPYLEADFCDDKSAAVTAVRIHLRKVRTVS